MTSRKPLRTRGLPGQVAVIFVVAISCLLIAVLVSSSVAAMASELTAATAAAGEYAAPANAAARYAGTQ